MTTFRRGRPAWRAAVPLPEMIAAAVAEAIAMGRLLPDDRVVETTVAAELGVSRVPTREALKVLFTQGILTGGRRGFRVAGFDAAMIARILELRLMLETLLLRDAIMNWRDGTAEAAALDEAIAGLEAAARRGEKLGSLRADLAFHRAIGVAARNGVTLTLWEAIARHALIIFSRPEYRDDDLAAVVAQHRALRQFIHDQIANPGPAEALRQGIEAHLLQVPRARGIR